MLRSVAKFIFICLYVSVYICSSDGRNMHEIVSVSAVFAFGDSFVDTGNNNYVSALGKADFPPYGKDFMGGIATGRFSNGKNIADFFVEGLGVKEYLPAYLNPLVPFNDLLTGVSFASGGSGYDPSTTNLTRAIPLFDQLNLFKDYIGKLKMNVGEEATMKIITNSVFLVVASTNDLAISLPRSQDDVLIYDSMLVKMALGFVQELYKLGARRIVVFSAPPVGCVPLERTLFGGIRRMCYQKKNEEVELYNSMLKEQLPILESSLPQSRIAFVDFYNPLMSVINDPRQYGLEVTDRGCCGTGLIAVTYLCNIFVGTCPDDTKFFFWDSVHLSEIGCNIFANMTLPSLVESLF